MKVSRKTCAIYGCTPKRGCSVQYHSFPKSKLLRQEWVFRCRRSDKFNPKTSRICDSHFSSKQKSFKMIHSLLNYYPKTARNLKPEAVPDINLPCDNYHDLETGETLVKFMLAAN